VDGNNRFVFFAAEALHQIFFCGILNDDDALGDSMYPVIGVTVPPQTRYRPWWRSTMGATRARYWEKRSGIVDVDINQSIYGQGDRTQQVVRSQRFEPVLVNFLDGLIGPGGLVCVGSSSPWG
jgi:hypothetical protein